MNWFTDLFYKNGYGPFKEPEPGFADNSDSLFAGLPHPPKAPPRPACKPAKAECPLLDLLKQGKTIEITIKDFK